MYGTSEDAHGVARTNFYGASSPDGRGSTASFDSDHREFISLETLLYRAWLALTSKS